MSSTAARLLITILLAFSSAVATACKGREASAANPQTWAPEKLSSVRGVPATEIESLIQQKLAGAKLDQIDDDQWRHTKSLYKLYGNNPLWLTSDGLHKTPIDRKISGPGFQDCGGLRGACPARTVEMEAPTAKVDQPPRRRQRR